MQSKDYGKCKSLRKDGQPCGNVVNLRECPYCEHHMTKEFRKLSSKRANLNDWSSGPPMAQTVAVGFTYRHPDPAPLRPSCLTYTTLFATLKEHADRHARTYVHIGLSMYSFHFECAPLYNAKERVV